MMCKLKVFHWLQELIAKSEGLTRRSKDPSPGPMKGKEPLTLSALRAAAGNTSKPNAKKAINHNAPAPAAAPAASAPTRPAAHKKPEKVIFRKFKRRFEILKFLIIEQCPISFCTQTSG